jgi:hypothetical protein
MGHMKWIGSSTIADGFGFGRNAGASAATFHPAFQTPLALSKFMIIAMT